MVLTAPVYRGGLPSPVGRGNLRYNSQMIRRRGIEKVDAEVEGPVEQPPHFISLVRISPADLRSPVAELRDLQTRASESPVFYCALLLKGVLLVRPILRPVVAKTQGGALLEAKRDDRWEIGG